MEGRLGRMKQRRQRWRKGGSALGDALEGGVCSDVLGYKCINCRW